MSPSGQPRNFNQKLEERGETLYHQVHPLQVAEDGLPWTKAFMPNSGDDDLMSTRREAIGGKRAYDEYVAMTDEDGNPLESIGSWAFTVGDVLDSHLVVFDDAGIDGQPEGHASVDFRDLGSKVAYRAGKALRDAAFNNTLNV